MEAPNQIDSKQVRLDNALKFLDENPTERVLTAARIFNVNATTIHTRRRRRNKHPGLWGGQNKILQSHEQEVIQTMIRSLLASQIQPTPRNPEKKPPSTRWFRIWWKANELDKITCKPLATVNPTVLSERDISEAL
ncbi:hypothetical protein BP6252_01966 [Coleophoma cylindrospora]|uniref:Uncharacterized protein n=1 Tax=Coleophoma cylindrospora TaxID=1849047 RepID=A0A3D8SDF6_9HELO|nr:hypothetical protein BP6252_01966 [Coleophoma cylindrospora]